jgi:hypothetical protein
MNPNTESAHFPCASMNMNHTTSTPSQNEETVHEKLSMSPGMDARMNQSWEQNEMESPKLILPPPHYRYPRRGAFAHSTLLRSAVLASIDSSGSCDDSYSGIRHSCSWDATLQGKRSPLKRSRNMSDMEEDFDSTQSEFGTRSIDTQSLSIRLPGLLTSSRRVSRRTGAASSPTDLAEYADMTFVSSLV